MCPVCRILPYTFRWVIPELNIRYESPTPEWNGERRALSCKNGWDTSFFDWRLDCVLIIHFWYLVLPVYGNNVISPFISWCISLWLWWLLVVIFRMTNTLRVSCVFFVRFSGCVYPGPYNIIYYASSPNIIYRVLSLFVLRFRTYLSFCKSFNVVLVRCHWLFLSSFTRVRSHYWNIWFIWFIVFLVAWSDGPLVTQSLSHPPFLSISHVFSIRWRIWLLSLARLYPLVRCCRPRCSFQESARIVGAFLCFLSTFRLLSP